MAAAGGEPMADLPSTLRGLPVYWRGTDDSTPPGCELICTEVVGYATTYITRDGVIIGRIETHRRSQHGYTGADLKGGGYIGTGLFYELATKIAEAS